MDLQIENLNKTYANGIMALDNVSLRIPTGMFGLLGPNGAGKSTLMRSVATLQQPDSGKITLGSLDVLSHKNKVKSVLGYLPQEFGFYPKDTTYDMLDHFTLLKGVKDKKARKEKVEELLKRVNLWNERNQKLGTFSGGMKQRFGIAQALIGNPELIIVDEPTAGLDPEERIRFHNLLSEIGENVIVILSTHIVEDVSDLCTKMAIIDRGKIILTDNTLDAISTLKGKIWEKEILKSDLPEYEQNYHLISSRLFAGKTYIRIYGDTNPDNGFSNVQETLEDVYFYHLSQTKELENTHV